jgi:hypothetical protein
MHFSVIFFLMIPQFLAIPPFLCVKCMIQLLGCFISNGETLATVMRVMRRSFSMLVIFPFGWAFGRIGGELLVAFTKKKNCLSQHK